MPITQNLIYAPETIGDFADTLPAGNLVGQIVDIDDSKATKEHGHYMLTVTIKITEPSQARGLQHTEYFAIGTLDDPRAALPETWNGMAGKRFAGPMKGLLACAGIGRTGSTMRDAALAVGQSGGRAVTHRIEGAVGRDGRPNQYAGQVRAEVRFFKPGEREVGFSDAAPKAALPARRPALPPSVNGQPSAPPSGGGTLTCPKCRGQVGREEFRGHVGACQGATAPTA